MPSSVFPPLPTNNGASPSTTSTTPREGSPASAAPAALEAWSPVGGGRRTPLDRSTMLVSVLVPVYNEAATVEAVVDRVRAVARAEGLRVEVLCVDDASTDGSAAALARLLADGRVDRVLRHERNRGKGAAVRAALAASRGDVVLVQDADLEYDPADWPALLAPITAGLADAVFGSRFLGGPHRVLYYWHSVGNRVLTTLSNMLTNLNLTDMETGTKAVRGDLARAVLLPKLTADRFGFEPELTARLAQAKARVYEVPVSYAGRTYAEGKKIRWTDGVAALRHILAYNLVKK